MIKNGNRKCHNCILYTYEHISEIIAGSTRSCRMNTSKFPYFILNGKMCVFITNTFFVQFAFLIFSGYSLVTFNHRFLGLSFGPVGV